MKPSSLGGILSWGCHNETPQAEELNQQKFVFLRFCRLESPRPTCQKVWFLLREALLLDLPMSTFWLCPVTVPSCQSTSSCVFLFSREHQSDWIRAPPHLTLITSLETLSPNTVTLRVRVSTFGLVGVGGRFTVSAVILVCVCLSVLQKHEGTVNFVKSKYSHD